MGLAVLSRLRLAGLALLGCGAFASTAHADPRVSVTEHGETCPGLTLQDRIDAYLEPSAPTSEVAEEARWSARGTLSRESSGLWRVDLAITAPGGTKSRRLLRAESCATAIDAAANVLTLAIDPQTSGRTPPPLPVTTGPGSGAGSRPPSVAPSEQADAEVVTERSPTDQTPEHEPDEERDGLQGLLRISAGFTAGSMPGINAAFGAALGLMGEHWRIELYGFYRLTTTVEADLVDDAGGRLSQYAVGPRACWVPAIERPKQRRFEFPVCAGAEAGEVLGQGYGFEGAGQARRSWGAVTLSPGVSFVIVPQVALVASGEVGFALSRKSLFIEGLETIHRIGPVSGRAWLALEARFP